jgi:hypothetical protein
MQYFFSFQAAPLLDNLGHVLQMGWDALPWIVVTPVAIWSAMSLKDQAIPAVLASNLCWWVLCALLGAVLLPSGISGGTLGVILPLAIGLGALIEAGVDRYWAPKPYRLWTDGLIVFCLLGAVGFTVVLFQVLPDELPATQWQRADVMAPAATIVETEKLTGDLSAGPVGSSPVAPPIAPTSKLSETKAKLSGYVAGIPLWKLKFLYFPVIGLFCGLALFVLSILQQAGLTPWVMVTMSWLSALGLFCVAMPAYHPDSSQSLVHWFNTLRPQALVLWLPQDFAAPVQDGAARPLAQEVRRYTSLTNVFKTLPPSPPVVASVDGHAESTSSSVPVPETTPPKMQWALVDEVAYYRLPWTQRSGWSVRGYFMVPKSPLNRLFLQASPYGLGPRQLLLVQGLPQELLPETTDSATPDFSGSAQELR